MKYELGNFQIPGFRVERLIGNGSFTRVYFGTDINTSLPCAIKVLNDREVAGSDEKYIAKKQDLAHEVLIGKLLRHELVIAPYAGGEVGNIVYAVLPYFEPDGICSRNLAKTYPPGTVLKPTQVEEITSSISTALQHCHDRGVVHCDVKPNNFLIGKDKKIKISDFGISLAKGIDSRISMGPTHFAAPEQIRKNACFRSDQYSLACVAYLYLAGRYPFHDGDKDEIRRMHQEDNIPRMGLENKVLETVICKAMSKNPNDRYSSITEFSQEFALSIH